jgi:N-acylneuraminate cytidylyltransferase
MIVAIIPARGGSKRIPKKNIREFAGLPIIAWSIKTAIRSNLFDKVIVSTDDPEIADVSISFGAEVPFIRPKELSNDIIGVGPVIAHATNFCNENYGFVDAICSIHATAPFIDLDDLKNGYKILKEGDWEFTFGVSSFPAPIFRSFKRESNGAASMFFPEHFLTRSQDLPEAFYDAAQFYWGKPTAWLEGKRMFDKHSYTIPIPSWRVQDIDTLDDWKRAEILFEQIKKVSGVA